MQQPRQMYGLGSFVKKITRKVTKPVTKVAKKLVPKEIAGIMRVAAPFLPPGYREAAYLLGTAKQTGRISPVDLALVSLPYANKALGSQKNLPLMERQGFFAEQFPRANQFLFGGKELQFTDGTPITKASIEARGFTGQNIPFKDYVNADTTGILGTGGKMFQFGKGAGPAAFRDQTKLGSFLLEGDPGKFSMSKLAGLGIGTLSLIQNSKTPEEAGTALAEATGNSDDYERGKALFSQLPQGIFDIPEAYRLPAQAGGLMRTNYAQGSEYIRKRPNFFKDLFLDREGGGGRDYMLPMEASERKDLTEGMIFGADDMAKAKELEARKIFPFLQDKTMQILDVVLDMPDSEEKNKILYDINHGILDKQKDSGMAGIANARYETIQKYGYLLDEDKGLGSMQARKANGGLMRENYAMGSGMKMAEFDMQDYMQEFERVFPEMRGKRGTQEYMDMLEDYFRGLASKNKEGIMMAKEGGRANLALGSMPTAQESGLGGLPIEADMRYTGGFMPYGAKEKADDVPARLSKNEFVFTADAVRAAGGGSVNEGAKKMYQAMKQLEAKPEAKGMMA